MASLTSESSALAKARSWPIRPPGVSRLLVGASATAAPPVSTGGGAGVEVRAATARRSEEGVAEFCREMPEGSGLAAAVAAAAVGVL